jgi:hypothetical protein
MMKIVDQVLLITHPYLCRSIKLCLILSITRSESYYHHQQHHPRSPQTQQNIRLETLDDDADAYFAERNYFSATSRFAYIYLYSILTLSFCFSGHLQHHSMPSKPKSPGNSHGNREEGQQKRRQTSIRHLPGCDCQSKEIRRHLILDIGRKPSRCGMELGFSSH